MPRYNITAVGVYGYVLVLNPMTANTESTAEFGPFESLDELRAFYDAESVEHYKDEGPNMFGPGPKIYYKTFRKGGRLEWMNPLTDSEWESPSYFGHGVYEVLLRVEQVNKLSQVY